jgi:hypothetical protein
MADSTSGRRSDLARLARQGQLAWIDGRDPSDPVCIHSNSLPVTQDLLDFLKGLEGSAASPAAASPATESLLPEKERVNELYSHFIDNLKHIESSEISHAMQKFIGEYTEKFLITEHQREAPGTLVQQFYKYVHTKILSNRLWRNGPRGEQMQEPDSPYQWFEEPLEQFIMGKLHATAFATIASERDQDVLLSERIAALSFVTPHHLDLHPCTLSPDLQPMWERAVSELLEMNAPSSQSPAAKVRCVLQCCHTITLLLSEATQDDGSVPGADDFLPALIYVVLRANPPRLHSNLQYIQHFRDPGKVQTRVTRRSAH